MSGKKHQLAGTIGEDARQVIHAVVDEIMSPDQSDKISELMPVVDTPNAILLHEKVAGFGGLTQERVLGEKGKSVNKPSSAIHFFKGGSYQEFIPFDEEEMLTLRKLGTLGERGITGVSDRLLNQLERAGRKLQRRLQNQMDKLRWDAFFNGNYVHKGITFDFEVPAGNALTAATDWDTPATSDPFDDLELILNQEDKLRKYSIRELIMNGKTGSNMRRSASTKGSRLISNANIPMNDINVLAQFIVPGLPILTEVKDSFQTESFDNEGIVTLSDAQFFVPDSKLLVVPDLSRAEFPAMGELQIQEHMNSAEASIDSPGSGAYVVVDEKGLEDISNPHMKVLAGFNGGPNLLRSDDTFVISV